MQKMIARMLYACTLILLAGGTAFADTAATPSPKPTPSPSPFAYSGYFRGYYFTRQNASGYLKGTGQINQASFTPALSLHGAYTFSGSDFTVGATYLYADPFNNCGDPVTHVTSGDPCYNKKAPKSGTPYFNFQGTNPDDTLPGYRLNALYEAYLQYKSPTLYAKIGDQVINTPWANASDSRLKPVAFEGADLSYKFTPQWTGELSYFNRFEDRVESNFHKSTLLTTTNIMDAPGAASNLGLPPYSFIQTNGFGYGRLGYAMNNVAANLHYYSFQDIANALWLDGKYSWKTYSKPFIALQFGNEKNTGASVIGKVDSSVLGIQAGLSASRNIDLAVSYDDIPEKSDRVVLPSGTSCQTSAGSVNEIKGLLPYFLPAGGTPNCVSNADGTTTVYYGGWASPYTDSYATDPLFTTTISQGMADRRSPGQSEKVAGTFTTTDKRFRFIAAHAWYSYGNATTGTSPTQETNLDATYYFSKVPKTGAYHGLFLRHRYAERTIANTQLYGGLPLFKYNRTQLEFDF